MGKLMNKKGNASVVALPEVDAFQLHCVFGKHPAFVCDTLTLIKIGYIVENSISTILGLILIYIFLM